METERNYLEAAMEEARHAFNQRTYPVGAVIVEPGGEIIGRGHNQVFSKGDFTSHAEVEAIREACGKLMLKRNYGRCTLYTTLEPCIMCYGAIIHSRIAHIVWIKNDEIHGVFHATFREMRNLNEIYARKCVALNAHQVDEPDLEHTLDSWMKEWNNMKELVLVSWNNR